MEDKELEEALAASIDESFNKSELDDIMNEIENLEKEFSEDSSQEGSDGLALKQAKNNNLQDAIDQEVESMITENAPEEEASPEVIAETPAEEIEEPVEAQVENKEFSQDLIDAAFSQKPEATEIKEETEEVISEPVSEHITEAEMTDETFSETPTSEADEEVAFSDEELADVTSGLDDEEVETISESHDHNNVVSLNKEHSAGSNVDFQASGTMDLSVNLNIAGQNAHLKVEDGALVVHLNGVSLEISEENGCSVKMAGGVNFNVPINATESKKKAS